VKKSIKKAIEDDPLEIVRTILESDFPLTVPGAQRFRKRFEDDGRASISVVFSKDDDGWMQVIGKPDPKDFHTLCRFRTPSGKKGESPRTRVALLILAEAIRLDNEEHPQVRGK